MPDPSTVAVEQVDSFWSKVDRRGPDECWPWLGGIASTGCGRVWVNRSPKQATRVAWEIANGGPFPAGKRACHSCDNPICVNPAHIWPGTQAENIQDCVAKGRHASKPHTHCKRGHELTPENRSPDATKRCLICLREHKRLSAQRRRQREREQASG